MGERSPHLDPYARGCFFGLSAIHSRAHIIRAVMEGVSYSQLDCVNVFRDMGIEINDMLACGGGGKSQFWRQMLADIYNCEVSTLATNEGPALGVAILAGVGAGVFESVESACEKIIKKNNVHEPDKNTVNEYKKYYEMFKNLYPVMKDSYKILAKI